MSQMTHHPTQSLTMKTPEQRRRNRKTGLFLLLFVVAVFGWVIYKQYMIVNP